MTPEQEKDILEYIQKYATKRGITIEEAKKHLMVKMYEQYRLEAK